MKAINMKRKIAAAAAVVLAVTPMTGCKKEMIDSKPTASSISAEDRAEENAQEALANMYKAQYAFNGGETCFGYMYPRIVLNELKRNGRYDELIGDFDNSQRQYVQNISHIPEITEFTGQKELDDAQLKAAAQYLVSMSANDPIYIGLDTAGINITEGVELRCDIIDQNGNADTDVECLVYIESDGWKVIPVSAEKLGKAYPAE